MVTTAAITSSMCFHLFLCRVIPYMCANHVWSKASYLSILVRLSATLNPMQHLSLACEHTVAEGSLERQWCIPILKASNQVVCMCKIGLQIVELMIAELHVRVWAWYAYSYRWDACTVVGCSRGCGKIQGACIDTLAVHSSGASVTSKLIHIRSFHVPHELNSGWIARW